MPSSPAGLVEVPARIAGLAFSYLRPADFHAVDLPEETVDFEKPELFIPLQIVMANYGAVLFTVSARPAYGDGTVEDWAEFLARESKMTITSLKPGIVGGLPVMMMEATQESELGQMHIRVALLEDGTRMINLMVMAPESLWASVEPTLQLTMSSFRLAEVRGATAVLTRAAAEKAAAQAIPAKATAEEEPAEATPVTAAASEPTPIVELALADDASSLDPELPFNVRMRNNGGGLTTRVLETHPEQKYAVVGAGALEAMLKVPFGWHAIDDGRRTLVFDSTGKIQISLNLRRDNGDHRALLERVLAETQEQQPAIDPVFVDFAPDMPGLVLRNFKDGDDVLVQAFIMRQVRDDGLTHVGRVTAAPDDMTRAMNLAEVLMRSINIEALASTR